MRCVVLLICTVTIAGCAARKAQERREAAFNGQQQCAAQWPVVTRETAVPRAQCMNAVEENYVLPFAGEAADLVQQRIAWRNAYSARVAAGELSVADYQLKFAEFNTQLVEIDRERRAQNAVVNAQSAQAAAAQQQVQQQNWLSQQRIQQDTLRRMIPQTTNTNCNVYGTNVSCQSTTNQY